MDRCSVAAIGMEEVTPAGVSNASLLAPEEVFDKRKTETTANSELSTTEKKRIRVRIPPTVPKPHSDNNGIRQWIGAQKVGLQEAGEAQGTHPGTPTLRAPHSFLLHLAMTTCTCTTSPNKPCGSASTIEIYFSERPCSPVSSASF